MNETESFDLLFRSYYQPLLVFAQQYVGDSDDCRDIVSAAFEDLWRNFSRIDHQHVRAYLYTLVRNKCVDHLRHRGTRRQYIEFVTILSDRFTDTDTLAEEDDRRHRVRQVLALLKPPADAIFRECFLHQKRYQQVADELGLSLSVVKKHMARALRVIREKYLKKDA
jgi:RNA polymerase sigma-70 factor (ECF subfamily)